MEVATDLFFHYCEIMMNQMMWKVLYVTREKSAIYRKIHLLLFY